MSNAATESLVFNLSGPGVRVTYRTAGPQLDLDGYVAGLGFDQKTFEADGLEVEETGIGTWVNAHLLTSRASMEIDFRLLIPAVLFDEDEDEAELTAVALTTTDTSKVGASPPARCDYDVRQLHGTVARVGD